MRICIQEKVPSAFTEVIFYPTVAISWCLLNYPLISELLHKCSSFHIHKNTASIHQHVKKLDFLFSFAHINVETNGTPARFNALFRNKFLLCIFFKEQLQETSSVNINIYSGILYIRYAITLPKFIIPRKKRKEKIEIKIKVRYQTKGYSI